MLKAIAEQIRDDIASLLPSKSPESRPLPGLARQKLAETAGWWRDIPALDTACPSQFATRYPELNARRQRGAALLLAGIALPLNGLLALRRLGGSRSVGLDVLAPVMLGAAACLWAAGHLQHQRSVRHSNKAGLLAVQQGAKLGALGPPGAPADIAQAPQHPHTTSRMVTGWKASMASNMQSLNDVPMMRLRHYGDEAMSVASMVQGPDMQVTQWASEELPVQLRDSLRALQRPHDQDQVRAALRHACTLAWAQDMGTLPKESVAHAAVHATAVVFYDQRMVVAHAGRGRALLCDSQGAQRLTVDHTPNGASTEGIDAAIVSQNSTRGVLLRAPTDGQRGPKAQVTFVPPSPDPNASVVLLSPEVATVLGDAEVSAFVQAHSGVQRQAAAGKLLDAARARGASGNLYAMIVPVSAAKAQNYAEVPHVDDYQLPKQRVAPAPQQEIDVSSSKASR